MRKAVHEKMQEKFDAIEVPRSISINDLCLALVVNLSLTGGAGFYLLENKENISESRRLVLRLRENGEYIDDFTSKGKGNHQSICLVEIHSFIHSSSSHQSWNM